MVYADASVNDHVYVIKIQNGEKVMIISKLKRYYKNKLSQDLNPLAKEFTTKQIIHKLERIDLHPQTLTLKQLFVKIALNWFCAL